jgi:hypothetical protein
MAIATAVVSMLANLAVFGTRRAGKTEVLMRVLLAMMLVRDRFVVRMLTNVLSSPTANILARGSDGGMVKLLQDLGLVPGVCKIRRIGSQRSVVEITFVWGSSFYVHDIGNSGAIDNKAGFSANIYWIDEATKTPLLEFALKDLINPTLADHGGIKLLSYTPDEEVDGLPAALAMQDGIRAR